MSALERWQSLISQNIASSTVPGFKKTEMSFEGMAMGQLDKSGQPAIVPVDTTQVSFETGTFAQTQNPTDLAIEGKGFFVVRDEAGQEIFTRDGEFHLDTQNQLVNKNGLMVQGVGGTITLIPGGGDLSVNSEGQIYQGSQLIDRVKVVAFEDNNQLTRVKGGFLQGNAQAQDSGSTKIVQGFLEGSNVSAIDEMVNLIQVNRAQEANQKVIQTYDARLSKVIQTFS